MPRTKQRLVLALFDCRGSTPQFAHILWNCERKAGFLRISFLCIRQEIGVNMCRKPDLEITAKRMGSDRKGAKLRQGDALTCASLQTPQGSS